MGEWVQYLQETLTTDVSLIIIGAGFFGLFFGWLMARPWGKKSPREDEGGAMGSDVSEELNWRHEKLILLERQEVERELRLQGFLEGFSISHGGTETEVRARFFALAEGLRSMRARVGTDLSRLSLAMERLEKFKADGAPRPDALDACIDMASGQVERLKELRDALRPVSTKVTAIEKDLEQSQFSALEEKDSLVERFEEVRSELEVSNANMSVLANETDRGIRDLLGAGKEEVYEPLRNVLLVDGSNTGSLPCSPSESLSDELSALILALKGLEAPDEEPESAEETTPAPAIETVDLEEPVLELADEEPESDEPVILGSQIFPGFSNASDGNDEAASEAEPALLGEAPEDGEEEDAQDSMVIFRSNDVELWGKDVYRGLNCRARSLATLPSWARWIGIRRLDTGERVFSKIDQETYEHGGNGDAVGFNASNELFYGARHLGMFSDSCPNEVETRFTYGGWGFGHRVSDPGNDSATTQASGWEGKEIPADTVFEISLFADLPDLEEQDSVLEG